MKQRIREAVERDGLAKHLRDVLIASYEAVISREVVTVSDLIDYLEELDWDPKLDLVAQRCYTLIREMHWGIFRDLDPEFHPELWKSLTVSNRRMPALSDLKRNVQVPNVYCAIMDIHAYTEFCQRNRHNASMLRTLDEVIQRDIRDIARKHGCLSVRSAGDNIVVLGSSPGEIIRSCLGIIDAFSRRRVLRAASLSESRRGNAVLMDDLHISAGIAGGLKYHSLILTQDGDISGSVVNTAARLQGFANRISPAHSKVMITSHVYSGYQKERKRWLEESEALTFFNCGKVRFKGTRVVVYELLYSEEEMKKARYQELYDQVQELTASSRWSDRHIPTLLALLETVLDVEPVPRVSVETGPNKGSFSSRDLQELAREIRALFETGVEPRRVSAQLKVLEGALRNAKRFNPLVLAHFTHIVALYDRMTRHFESLQYQKILENQTGLFTHRERSVIDGAARMEKMRRLLIERGKKENNIYSAPVLWNRIVSEFDGTWEFEIYSGKE